MKNIITIIVLSIFFVSCTGSFHNPDPNPLTGESFTMTEKFGEDRVITTYHFQNDSSVVIDIFSSLTGRANHWPGSYLYIDSTLYIQRDDEPIGESYKVRWRDSNLILIDEKGNDKGFMILEPIQE